MFPDSVEKLLKDPTDKNVIALFDDDTAVFAVDWREEDDAIDEYCESILKTGSLAAEVNDIDTDPGFEMTITYGEKRVLVPHVAGDEDRHITLQALNQVLTPDYEVRVLIDSNGSDTLVFLPLSAAGWKTLEAKYGETVANHFGVIQEKPNLFTDPW